MLERHEVEASSGSFDKGPISDAPPPAEHWTEPEKWIWRRTLAGEIADLNKRCGSSGPLDPRKDDPRWLDKDPDRSRRVTERFLLDVLTREPYSSALPVRGLRVVGALVVGKNDEHPVNLSNLSVQELWLRRSRFLKHVFLPQTRFEFSLFLDGSAFVGELDMSYLKVGGMLNLDDVYCGGKVRLGGAEVGGQVTAERAVFRATLNMGRLKTGGLFLREARCADEVDLLDAEIGGEVAAGRAVFRAALVMDRLRARGLFLNEARCADEVGLLGAEIGGVVTAERAVFRAALVMDRLKARDLFLNEARCADKVRLSGAQVNGVIAARFAMFGAELDMNYLKSGNLSLSNSRYRGEVFLLGAELAGQVAAERAMFWATLNMDRLKAGDSLFLRDARCESGVRLVGAEVGGNFDVSGSAFKSELDSSGARFGGDLRLGSNVHPRATWKENGRLTLRNTSVGAFQDRLDKDSDGRELNAWPAPGNLELDGFTYERLGGFGGVGPSDMSARPMRWYLDWLARDRSYAPQPYQQLARVFREAGAYDRATDILYAARQRERSEAPFWRRLGLWLLELTIGYGLGKHYFRVVLWVLALAVLGTLALWTSAPALAEAKSLHWCAWASLDWTLPLITLNDEYAEVVNKTAGWRFLWLNLQALFGFVLASFLVAALAGLTQRA